MKTILNAIAPISVLLLGLVGLAFSLRGLLGLLLAALTLGAWLPAIAQFVGGFLLLGLSYAFLDLLKKGYKSHG